MKIKLGCRGSELSLHMAELVTKKLEQLDCTVEIISPSELYKLQNMFDADVYSAYKSIDKPLIK